jgi:hypothetical protein
LLLDCRFELSFFLLADGVRVAWGRRSWLPIASCGGHCVVGVVVLRVFEAQIEYSRARLRAD